MAKASAPAKRTTITVRLTPIELARVQALAEHHGLNVSSWIRMMAAREARELGVETTG